MQSSGQPQNASQQPTTLLQSVEVDLPDISSQPIPEPLSVMFNSHSVNSRSVHPHSVTASPLISNASSFNSPSSESLSSQHSNPPLPSPPLSPISSIGSLQQRRPPIKYFAPPSHSQEMTQSSRQSMLPQATDPPSLTPKVLTQTIDEPLDLEPITGPLPALIFSSPKSPIKTKPVICSPKDKRETDSTDAPFSRPPSKTSRPVSPGEFVFSSSPSSIDRVVIDSKAKHFHASVSGSDSHSSHSSSSDHRLEKIDEAVFSTLNTPTNDQCIYLSRRLTLPELDLNKEGNKEVNNTQKFQ